MFVKTYENLDQGPSACANDERCLQKKNRILNLMECIILNFTPRQRLGKKNS